MRFTFTADIHSTEYVNDVYDSNISRKLNAIYECLNELAEYTRKNIPDKICVIGGDIFDKNNYEYTASLELFDKFISFNNDIHFITITGNHDISDRTDNCYNLLRLFTKHKNFELIDYNEYKKINNILFVSYNEKMMEFLRKAVDDYPECKILISHFGVNEAYFSNNMKGLSKIKFKDLCQQFNLILLGDYHKPQFLKVNNSELYYSGSVIQKTAGEINENKRFLDVHIIDDNNWDIKEIFYTKYPKYVKLICNKNNLEEIKKEYNNHIKIGNYPSIIYETDDKITTKEKNKINKLIEEDIKIIVETNTSDKIDHDISIDLNVDNIEKLKLFLEKKVNNEDIDKYMDIIKELII